MSLWSYAFAALFPEQCCGQGPENHPAESDQQAQECCYLQQGGVKQRCIRVEFSPGHSKLARMRGDLAEDLM